MKKIVLELSICSRYILFTSLYCCFHYNSYWRNSPCLSRWLQNSCGIQMWWTELLCSAQHHLHWWDWMLCITIYTFHFFITASDATVHVCPDGTRIPVAYKCDGQSSCVQPSTTFTDETGCRMFLFTAILISMSFLEWVVKRSILRPFDWLKLHVT